MQTTQPTPFEKHEQTQIDNGVMFSAMAAAMVLVKSVLETDAQIAWYRKLLLTGEEGQIERAIERAATAEAMKESRAVNKSIIAIANTLEDKFNISA
jgi:hypothetical protein